MALAGGWPCTALRAAGWPGRVPLCGLFPLHLVFFHVAPFHILSNFNYPRTTISRINSHNSPTPYFFFVRNGLAFTVFDSPTPGCLDGIRCRFRFEDTRFFCKRIHTLAGFRRRPFF